MSSPRRFPRINLDALAEHIQPQLEVLLDKYAPEAKRQANGWRLGNIYGEKGESLWIGDHGFRDHATGEQGSLLDLFAGLLGTSIIDAAKALAADTGFDIDAHDDSRELSEIQPTVTFGPLAQHHIEYLTGRGFDPGLLAILPINTASNGAIAFRHYTESGKLAFVKFKSVATGDWWSDKTETHHVPWLVDYVSQVFPNHTTLYITEGHWDALTATQAGFPAISIPNGASNHHWIENCLNFIGSFKQIVLCYDADTAGAEALALAAGRISKPISVIDLPDDCKDLNDVLQAHGLERVRELLNSHKPYDPPEVIRSTSLYELAKEEILVDFELTTPWDNIFPFRLRAHESTVLTAYTGHGKSNIVRQLLTWIAYRHKIRTFTASFEDTPLKNTHQILQSLHGHPDPESVLAYIDWFDPSHPKYNGKRVSLKTLLDLFTVLYQKAGVQFFVIDNLMCLDVNRDDLKDQADAAEQVRQWVLHHAAHLLLVAHPRKPPVQNKGLITPPDISEIRGASEIADTAFNILGHVRNIPKERDLDEKRLFTGTTPMEIARIDRERPDAILQCQKQRWTGKLPTLWLWRTADGNFHATSARDTHWW